MAMHATVLFASIFILYFMYSLDPESENYLLIVVSFAISDLLLTTIMAVIMR